MEVEVKYVSDIPGKLDEVYASDHVRKAELKGSRKTLEMDAVYFDSKDGILNQNQCAIRIRREGDVPMATIKWGGGSSENGLHKRKEINVKLSDEILGADRKELFGHMPEETFNIEWFKDTDGYEFLTTVSRGKELLPILHMGFTRRLVEISVEESVIELAVDSGSMENMVGSEVRRENIMELELELHGGDESVLMEFADKLRLQYGLRGEKRSKYARGLDLVSQG